MIPPGSDFHARLCAAQKILADSPELAPFYAFLSPSSFHMTVFDLFHEHSPDYVGRSGVNWADEHRRVKERSSSNAESDNRVSYDRQANAEGSSIIRTCT